MAPRNRVCAASRPWGPNRRTMPRQYCRTQWLRMPSVAWNGRHWEGISEGLCPRCHWPVWLTCQGPRPIQRSNPRLQVNGRTTRRRCRLPTHSGWVDQPVLLLSREQTTHGQPTHFSVKTTSNRCWTTSPSVPKPSGDLDDRAREISQTAVDLDVVAAVLGSLVQLGDLHARYLPTWIVRRKGSKRLLHLCCICVLCLDGSCRKPLQDKERAKGLEPSTSSLGS